MLVYEHSSLLICEKKITESLASGLSIRVSDVRTRRMLLWFILHT